MSQSKTDEEDMKPQGGGSGQVYGQTDDDSGKGGSSGSSDEHAGQKERGVSGADSVDSPTGSIQDDKNTSINKGGMTGGSGSSSNTGAGSSGSGGGGS